MPGPRLIFLARHGEAHTIDEAGRIRNYSDTGLTDSGRAQAEALRGFFQGIELRAVYSSDLKRSLETAGIAAGGRGLEIIPDPGLREFSIGEFEGKKLEDVVKEYFPAGNDPDSLSRFRSQVLASARFPGGESIPQLRERVLRSWSRIVDDVSGEGPVLVVAHGGVNRVILGEVLRIPMEMEHLARLDQDPAGVNLIVYPGKETGPDRGIVRLLNYTPYNSAKSDLRLDRIMLSILGVEEN